MTGLHWKTELERHIDHLKRKRSELDRDAEALAGQYDLWAELLPKAAYTPGRLATAVITVLEGRRTGGTATG